jgi:hypothetical protein
VPTFATVYRKAWPVFAHEINSKIWMLTHVTLVTGQPMTKCAASIIRAYFTNLKGYSHEIK